ncbi:hypothetical protein Droror1_Dr00006615 [Drosera rotundifolia]
MDPTAGSGDDPSQWLIPGHDAAVDGSCLQLWNLGFKEFKYRRERSMVNPHQPSTVVNVETISCRDLLDGRHPRFEATESDVGASKMDQESSIEKPEAVVRARLLRMNAHDYGNYNPTPSLSKPRYKLIPN